ncbi:unnamed protein product [Hyaloperonospora brassicae]|uniref:Uncharacterized protein n=1 Tax=Hyaloperonospora brassicae TaxID=162125 RepID=A0AAV0TI18_HYABA|nr:unnamed protein product [Hyaloperonospora brassicae]
MAVSVVVVDDHHHCLSVIHQAIRQRRLPFSHIHVLHVDAHPDLSFSTAINTDVVFEPETLYDALDDSVAGIAEFLLPLVFAGHVSQITWLKSVWATQIPTGTFRQLAIGKRVTNRTMGVASELPHFVNDELFCPLKNMETSSIRYWDLFATETTAGYAAAVAAQAMDNAREHSKGYILDIDLDYFSTWNPFRRDLEALIGEVDVETVTKVFCHVRYKQVPLDGLTAEQRSTEMTTFSELARRLEAADAQVDTDTRRSECAQIRGELVSLYADDVNVAELFDEFCQVLDRYRDNEAVRREIWTAGLFLDLPHHESSQEEIECLISELEHFLRTHALDGSNPPAIVTVAKSTGDQYLPPHQSDVVLTSVLRMLEQVYGELATKYVEYVPVEDADEYHEAERSCST